MWTGFAWLTGYGLGPLALLLAVGVGIVLRGADDGGNPVSGATGAVLIVLVMLVGRLWILDRVNRRTAEKAVTDAVNDHAMLLALAQQIAQQQLDAGNPPALPGGRQLPEGVAVVEFANREEVPDEIWQQAESVWQASTEEQRSTQIEQRRQYVVGVHEAGMPAGLVARFGFAGLFWTTMAAGTAFMIGGRMAV